MIDRFTRRSIRLQNPAFQSKVVAAPGGLELMLAAGFELQPIAPAPARTPVDVDNASSSVPVFSPPLAPTASGPAEGEEYLRHDASNDISFLKLRYVVSRLKGI